MTALLQRENLSCQPVTLGHRYNYNKYSCTFTLVQYIPLYTGAVTWILTVEQHSTWNRSAFNHPETTQWCFQADKQPIYHTTAHYALHCLCQTFWPLEDILKQYRDTLCSAQKQTNFTNTLIQDIPIFNGNDGTQFEDWLVGIETASDLSAESRTKLAQAKSKGLTHFNYRSSYLR